MRRAARRNWEPPSYAEVLAEIRARDLRDSQRATAPLLPAKDAVILDTSELDIAAAVEAAIAIADRRRR